VAGALLWIVAGLAASWLALTALVRDHDLNETREELAHHAGELAELGMLGPDGAPLLRQGLSDRRFAILGSGHYWQIARPGGPPLASPSLGDFRMVLNGGANGPALQVGPGPGGEMMLVQSSIGVGDSQLYLGVGIDRRQVEADAARFGMTLAISLAAIAAGLVLAVFAQISFGLSPLVRLRTALAAMRRGEADALPDDLPAEVAPLVENMNALLLANHDVVRRARLQAGNLAHALKGPLTILMDEGQRMSAAGLPGELVIAQCERMRRQIDYQLARARAAGASGAPSSAVRIAPAMQAVLAAVKRLHRDRNLAFTVSGVGTETAACEAQDFEEMLGNLLDNAAKWATSKVRIRLARTADGMLCLTVEDDGPGMPPDAMERVFTAGERLDEAMPGSGLGLAIVRDIARLYGGDAWLARSDLGGMAANITIMAGRWTS